MSPACSALLDEWAEQLANYRSPDDTAEDRVRALAHFLGGQLGFHGNTEDYYNPDNTLLPRAIETRMGIPITLTLLYMLVAGRCGLRVDGINFPGHFLARHDGVLFDPFERGRIIGLPECRQILARQKLELQPNHLEAATPIAMARRILANLLYVYQSEENRESAGNVTAGCTRWSGRDGRVIKPARNCCSGTRSIRTWRSSGRSFSRSGLRIQRQVTVPDGEAIAFALRESLAPR